MHRLLIAACLVVIAGTAYAEPPPGTDLNGASHKWWECHKQPSNGVTCCNLSDGHVLTDAEWRLQTHPSRMVDFPYEVSVKGKWFDVPKIAVLADHDECGADPNEETRSEAKVWYSTIWGVGNDDVPEKLLVYCFQIGILY